MESSLKSAYQLSGNIKDHYVKLATTYYELRSLASECLEVSKLVTDPIEQSKFNDINASLKDGLNALHTACDELEWALKEGGHKTK